MSAVEEAAQAVLAPVARGTFASFVVKVALSLVVQIASGAR